VGREVVTLAQSSGKLASRRVAVSDPLLHLTPEDVRRRSEVRRRDLAWCGRPTPPVAEQAYVDELRRADTEALSRRLASDPSAACALLRGSLPLLVLLRRSTGEPGAIRACARLLLDAGADPNCGTTTVYQTRETRETALLAVVMRGDITLAHLLFDYGAVVDREAYQEACVNEEFNDPDDCPFVQLLTIMP
jgi:hypothetical protein